MPTSTTYSSATSAMPLVARTTLHTHIHTHTHTTPLKIQRLNALFRLVIMGRRHARTEHNRQLYTHRNNARLHKILESHIINALGGQHHIRASVQNLLNALLCDVELALADLGGRSKTRPDQSCRSGVCVCVCVCVCLCASSSECVPWWHAHGSGGGVRSDLRSDQITANSQPWCVNVCILQT